MAERGGSADTGLILAGVTLPDTEYMLFVLVMVSPNPSMYFLSAAGEVTSGLLSSLFFAQPIFSRVMI